MESAPSDFTFFMGGASTVTACSVSITGFRLALTSQWLGLRLASDLTVKGAVLEQRHPIKYRVLGTSVLQ